MGFEIRAEGFWADNVCAGVADAVQGVAHGDSVAVFLAENEIGREFTDEGARTHHDGDKARSFFVCPDDHLDWRLRADSRVVQGAHDFEAGEHAVVAVEFAAGGLGINVAAGDDGRQGAVKAGPACEQVADGIDTDGAASGTRRPWALRRSRPGASVNPIDVFRRCEAT